MHNYKVGDKVEILGKKVPNSHYHQYSPEGVVFMDYYDNPPAESESTWTPVKIIKVNSGLLVAWKNDNHAWRVEGDKIPLFIRPLNSVQQEVAVPPSMATSCVECHTIFMYPVEYNCDQGRLCYGCKTTKAWKYSNIRG